MGNNIMAPLAFLPRRRVRLRKRNKAYDRFWSEYYDADGIFFNQECEIYELVDFLIRETKRLIDLVLEARSQANHLALWRAEEPYPMLGEDVYNACFDDHPAMLRYLELYGK